MANRKSDTIEQISDSEQLFLSLYQFIKWYLIILLSITIIIIIIIYYDLWYWVLNLKTHACYTGTVALNLNNKFTLKNITYSKDLSLGKTIQLILK